MAPVPSARRRWRRALPWPLPALLAWGGAWLLFVVAARELDMPLLLALALSELMAVSLGMMASTPSRRVFVAVGFPLSVVASGVLGDVPAWGWLLPLVALAAIYPMRAWRDAPLFPTPAGALDGLAKQVPMRRGARILDAGCGLGDALVELRRAYPHAALTGIEWSWALRLACAMRARFATVRRGDIWAVDWSSFDMVYLFQRPESMPRAASKAARELSVGAWMASLEFEVPGLRADRVAEAGPGRRLWLYQAPFKPA